MSKQKVCFLAPGSGLGHIVRATAIAIAIEMQSNSDISTTILSSSKYSLGLSRLTGVEIEHISLKDWSVQAIKRLAEITPDLIICDSFPFGINGELLAFPEFLEKSVYIARHLKFKDYLDRKLNRAAPANNALFSIIIEPLQSEHMEWISTTGNPVHTTKHPVIFPAERFFIPIPSQIQKILQERPIDLVIHSGPEQELKQLLQHTSAERCLLITPEPKIKGYRWLEYFPAKNLFKYADKIITGAGYNSMAEAAGYRKKHIAVAFNRNYDDQHARLEFDISNGNSGREIADLIGGLIF
ncbi:MAG: hypothetical protein D6B27_01280 [Gammaproteobacteria bacterium]|nr:MAG: hypothetical protein D6B27_01280 [Gammaproteobacteria bacterium]